MKAATAKVYRFGPFTLDTSQHLLLKDVSPIQLREKVFETLVLLVEAGGAVVSKDEFMEKIWPDAFVNPPPLGIAFLAAERNFGACIQSFGIDFAVGLKADDGRWQNAWTSR